MTKYRVTGTTPYLGHQPGEIFEAELDPEQEHRAIRRGAIKKTTAKDKAENETEEVDDG